MQAMLDFFANIGDIIFSICEWFISFLGDLLYMIQLTGQFLLKIPDYFSWLPGPAVSLIVVIFSIVVLYKVLGREG